MNKAELMDSLRKSLRGLPEEELNKSLDFYEEMIEDRMEDGMSEDEAVAAVGDVKDISAKILSDVSLPKLVKEKVKRRRGMKAWEIVLLAIGFPIWFPILITMAVLIFVLYLVFWCLIVSFYCVDLAFLLGGLGSIGFAIFSIVQGIPNAGIVLFGAGLILVGLSIPFFMLCNLFAKGMLKTGKAIILGIKYLFVGKREEENEEEIKEEVKEATAENVTEEVMETVATEVQEEVATDAAAEETAGGVMA